MAFYEYSIVANYNNAATLQNVETMIDASGNIFYPVRGHPSFEPGTPRTLSDGTLSFQGFPAMQWISGVMLWTGYLYIYTTVLAGAYSNEVTIRTRILSSAYVNYNAILSIPRPVELIPVRKGQAYINFVWKFTRMVAI